MRWISAADLARRLGISREGVSKAIRTGRIKSYRRNGRSIQCDALRAAAEFRGEEVPIVAAAEEEMPVVAKAKGKKPIIAKAKKEIREPQISEEAQARTAHNFMTWGGDTPEKMPEVERQTTAVNSETTKSEADRCRTIYRAERERLELLQLEKALVPVEQIRQDAYKMGREVMQNLLNLSDRLSFEFAGETDPAEIHKTLNREIAGCCEGLAAAGEGGE